MGVLILVVALFCLTVAVDKYYSAIKTAEELAKAMPGFELEATGIPAVSLVCGALGVMLLVASVILISKSFRQVEAEL